MNLKKLPGKAVSAVKRNPALALAILGLLAPKVATKAAGVLVALQERPDNA